MRETDVCNIVGDDPLAAVPACNNSAPLPLSAADNIDRFIYGTSAWLLRTKEVCFPVLELLEVF
jgi:hypothetical protein